MPIGSGHRPWHPVLLKKKWVPHLISLHVLIPIPSWYSNLDLYKRVSHQTVGPYPKITRIARSTGGTTSKFNKLYSFGWRTLFKSLDDLNLPIII